MTALLDTAAIASMLGLNREYVTDKLTKRPDFPRPALNLSRRLRRWKESDIHAWMAKSARSAPALPAESRASA